MLFLAISVLITDRAVDIAVVKLTKLLFQELVQT